MAQNVLCDWCVNFQYVLCTKIHDPTVYNQYVAPQYTAPPFTIKHKLPTMSLSSTVSPLFGEVTGEPTRPSPAARHPPPQAGLPRRASDLDARRRFAQPRSRSNLPTPALRWIRPNEDEIGFLHFVEMVFGWRWNSFLALCTLPTNKKVNSKMFAF